MDPDWNPLRGCFVLTAPSSSEQLTCMSKSVSQYEPCLIKIYPKSVRRDCLISLPLFLSLFWCPTCVWQNCNEDLGSGCAGPREYVSGGFSNGDMVLLIQSPSAAYPMNYSSSLQYWLLPALWFTDSAFVLCGLKSCRKHSFPALRAGGCSCGAGARLLLSHQLFIITSIH